MNEDRSDARPGERRSDGATAIAHACVERGTLTDAQHRHTDSNTSMLDKQYRFVLGAADPEMREIERVLRADGRSYLHAACAGQRCSPRDAYDADGALAAHSGRPGRPAVLLPKEPIVCVECRVRAHEPALRIDHHHPDDPGYAAAPEQYLRGSSLGQLLEALEREPTETQRLLAAGDHCLSAAYQGRCPGVDPNELLFLRAAWRAQASGRTLNDVICGVLEAARQVRKHYDGELDESRFPDPMEVPLDLAEGSAYAGIPVRYRTWTADGTIKEMFKGGTPEAVAAFMAEHRGFGRKVYGNPYRGYAGAYL